MKCRSTRPFLLCTALICAASLFSSPLRAAPQDAPKPTRPKRAPVTPRRIVRGIEAKTGQMLTPDQKKQLTTAFREQQAAILAAKEKFLLEASKIAGLSLEELREIEKPTRKTAAAGAPPLANAPLANAPTNAKPVEKEPVPTEEEDENDEMDTPPVTK